AHRNLLRRETRNGEKNPPDRGSDGPRWSFPKSSGGGSRRQKQPVLRQHFLKRLPDPQGQRAFLPSRSTSSLSPWTMRTPRFTCVSDGNPRRRLLIGSKKTPAVRGPGCPWSIAFPCKMADGTYFETASFARRFGLAFSLQATPRLFAPRRRRNGRHNY